MKTIAKLATYGAAVAVTFGGALAVGAAVGPIDVAGGSHARHAPTVATAPPRGLAVAAAGYRLELETTTIGPDSPSEFAFRVVDDAGATVTNFQELHQERLHLIVLSRNLVDYRHLHPTMDQSGRWTVALPALAPGSYRVFADFQPDGADNLTLGSDITVPGNVRGVAIPNPRTVSTVGGYTVVMDATPAVGNIEISFVVELNGQAVGTESYLGAAGHLVAIRSGDLAYLDVHPHDTNSSPATFTAGFPTAGTYRLFFDFSHDGTVRTATFTVVVPTP
jgi:hypothetical protein